MEQPRAIFDDYYEIVGELGRGTTGIVYEARHTRLNRRVAIKVPDLAPDAERPAKARRFLHGECRALARLTGGSGCNIPRLLVVTEYPAGHPYSVREFVEGTTLGQWAAQESIELRAGLAVVAEVARMVQWVHEQGFAHRNLSAANVLVARDGTPWLIGFGRVGLLEKSEWLPPGATQALAAGDVRGLLELVRSVCAAVGRPIPQDLDCELAGAATPLEARTAINRRL